MHKGLESKRLKVLLIILGAVIVLAGIGFFVWRSTASAAGLGDVGGIIGGIPKNSTEIRGTITAAGTNAKLADVNVKVKMGQDMYTEVESLTDGTYKVSGLKQGTEYILRFQKSGYAIQSVKVKTNITAGGFVKTKGVVKDIVMTLPMEVTLTNDTKGTNQVVLGTPVVLTWKVKNSNATTVCMSRQDWKPVDTQKSSSGGSESVTEPEPGTYDYTLSCKNPEDEIGTPASTKITVLPKIGTPVSTLGTLTGKVTLKGKTQTSGTIKFITISDSKTISSTVDKYGNYTLKGNVPKGTYDVKILFNIGTKSYLKQPFSFTFPTTKSTYIYNLAY